MPLTVFSDDDRVRPAGRRTAFICVLLSAGAFAASLLLTWQPAAAIFQSAGPGSGSMSLQQALSLLAAVLGLASGSLALLAKPDPAPVPAQAATLAGGPAQAEPGVQNIVGELRELLEWERGKLASVGEACATTTRDALAISKCLMHLADVATDAETRLNAGVDQAAEATQRVEQTLPELALLISRGIVDQSQAVGAALETAVARLTADADSPVQAFRAAVTEATGQISALGDIAEILSRDVTSFETASREIATAGATVVSRVNDAVIRADAALAQLPAAAEAVAATAEQAAQALADASVVLCTDSAALAAASQHIGQAAASIRQDSEELKITRQDIEQAGTGLAALLGDGAARIDAALALLPAAIETLTAASEDAARTLTTASEHAVTALTGASGVLCADSAGLSAVAQGLAASGQEAHKASAALWQETEAMKAVAQAIADAGHQANANVIGTVAAAAAQLAAVVADADAARQGSPSMAQLAATLEGAASTLLDGTYGLDAAGQRVAAAGESVAERLAADWSRGEAVLGNLPEIAVEMTAAMADLRIETSMLSGAARQIANASHDAAAAVANVAARVEASAASLDETGRIIGAANGQVSVQISQLAELAAHSETQMSLLPAAAADVAAGASALRAVADFWPTQAMFTVLPEVAARLEAAAPRLDVLDALRLRLEIIVAELQAQPPGGQAMAALSVDIGESVRRVEGALADHEGVWPAVVASIERVQVAVADVLQAAADKRDASRHGTGPGERGDGPQDVLAATLQHYEHVSSQAEMLLRQTEALAEAVLSGSAPDLPSLLAERTPGLLAGIEVTTRRLHSAATALALASDGLPASQRRST